MRYMLLIYTDPTAWEARSQAERDGFTSEYMTFTQGIIESGEFLAGDPLEGTDTATTVRVRGGATNATDGPFAETKEHLGGYYIVDCKDLDRAIELAARIPDARSGSVEVRPIIDMEMPS